MEINKVNFKDMAKESLDKPYKIYYTDEGGGHLLPCHCGKIVKKPLMIWENAMMLLAMENYYEATGDGETKEKILGTWRYLLTCFTDEQLAANFGDAPNLAIDDTGWDAMVYFMIYRLSGDRYALDLTKRCILGAYEHWNDGDLELEGLWYNDKKQYKGDQWKSSYVVSLIVTALELCIMTRGTDDYSEELWEKTLRVYKWVENNCRRDRIITFQHGLWENDMSYTLNCKDGLYFIDYNKDRVGHTERFGPDGGTRPWDIKRFGSVSALFANMGMAAVNMILYKDSGEGKYKKKAFETLASIRRVYNDGGAYLNDRDANVEATMIRYFVRDLLACDEVCEQDRRMLYTTAFNIYESEKNIGIFPALWHKVFTDRNDPEFPKFDTETIMILSTNVGMITGAAYLESLGYGYGK